MDINILREIVTVASFGSFLAIVAYAVSPAKITSVTTEVIKGNPNPRHISTSFVERQNWTVRTNMARDCRTDSAGS